MESLIEGIKELFSREDWFDTIVLYVVEHYELIIIAVAVIFIFILCLSVILERLRKNGLIALVPIYRFVVIFKAIGLSPWLVILMIIPGVNIFMRMVFYAILAQKFNRNIAFVPALTVLPIIFLPIVAFGEGQYLYVKNPAKARAKEAPKKSLEDKRRELKTNLKNKIDKINRSLNDNVSDDRQQYEDDAVLSMAEVMEERAIAREERARQVEPKPKTSQKRVSSERHSTGATMPMMKRGEMAQKYYEDEKTRRERLLKAQSKSKIDL